MNYRRGLQRIYVVCALVWVAGILALAIPNRPRTKIDYDALAKISGAIDGNTSGVPDDKAARGLTYAEIDKALQESKNGTVSKTPFVPPPLSSYEGDAPGDKGPLRIVKSEPLPGAVRSYWMAHSAAAFLPPLVTYFFLFLVVPWIYRGFRSS